MILLSTLFVGESRRGGVKILRAAPRDLEKRVTEKKTRHPISNENSKKVHSVDNPWIPRILTTINSVSWSCMGMLS
jgi:hypothetical protein